MCAVQDREAVVRIRTAPEKREAAFLLLRLQHCLSDSAQQPSRQAMSVWLWRDRDGEESPPPGAPPTAWERGAGMKPRNGFLSQTRCNGCGGPVVMRRIHGAVVMREDGPVAERAHECPADVIDLGRWAECWCGRQITVYRDGRRLNRLDDTPHVCPPAVAPSRPAESASGGTASQPGRVARPAPASPLPPERVTRRVDP